MKKFTGKVVSKKMDKTATVAVERIVAHPVYKKRFKRAKKYHVHDEMGAKVGQTVQFVESKPYSKTKRWKIIEIVNKDKKGKAKKKKSTEKKKTKSGKKGKTTKKK